MTPPLSLDDQHRLAACEAIIDRGLTTFYDVGKALVTIRDERLYRAAYPTWQAYLDDRWSFSRQRAQQLMAAVEVVDNVSTVVDIPSERAARELSRYTPELQKAVAQVVAAAAPDGRLTAPRIERAAAVLAEAVRTGGHVDVGSGRAEPITAALMTEEYEAFLRQREHLAAARAHKTAAQANDAVALPALVPVSVYLYNGHDAALAARQTLNELKRRLQPNVFAALHRQMLEE